VKRSLALLPLALIALAALLAGCAPASHPDASRATKTSTASPVALGTPTAHLVVVMLENKEYSQVVGSTAAPYVNGTLLGSGKLFTAHYASTHPSLPNYLVLTSGQYGGCINDSCPVNSIPGANLFSLMNQAATPTSWKVYAENMPSSCYLKNAAGYAVRHNPPLYYSNLGSGGDKTCSQRDVALPQLTTDLQGGTLPDFSMVIPNLWNDMHTDKAQAPCQLGAAVSNMICQGDNWLKTWIPQIVSDGGRNDTTVLITFDEGTTGQGGAGRVVLLEIGPGTCAGCTETRPSNHYGLSTAISQWFGLPPLYPSSPALTAPVAGGA
jgi:hypothetical protein